MTSGFGLEVALSKSRTHLSAVTYNTNQYFRQIFFSLLLSRSRFTESVRRFRFHPHVAGRIAAAQSYCQQGAL